MVLNLCKNKISYRERFYDNRKIFFFSGRPGGSECQAYPSRTRSKGVGLGFPPISEEHIIKNGAVYFVCTGLGYVLEC